MNHMAIYFIFYFLIIFGCFLIRKGRTKYKKQEAVYLTACLTMLMALRHPSMGTDLGYRSFTGYLYSFQRIADMSIGDVFKVKFLNYEKGYVLFNKLISFVSRDPQWLLTACAVLCFVLIGAAIYESSDNILFSFLVLFGLPVFLMYYSGLRQAIAISICFYSTVFAKDKKLLKFILTVLVATLFHRSAIFFLLVYPVFHLRFKKETYLLSVFGIAVALVFNKPIFRILTMLMKENVSISSNYSIVLLVVFSLMYVFCLIFINQEDEKTQGYLNIFYIACLVQCMAPLHTLAMRIGYYFMISLVVVLPNVIEQMSEARFRMVAKTFIPIIFVIYGLAQFASSSWAMSNPYHFFWENI